MNLAQLLINLIAVDNVSAPTARATAAVMRFAGIAGASSLNAAAQLKNMGAGVVQAAAGIAAGLALAAAAAKVFMATFEAMGDILKGSIDHAMRYQEAFALVSKTLEGVDAKDTATQLNVLRDAFVDLSTKIPVSATELAKIGAIAAQMGMSDAQDILKFTETVARLGASIDGISLEDMAHELSVFKNLMGLSAEETERHASVMVHLSNRMATNEGLIVRSAAGFAGMARAAGLSAETTLALASAMTSLSPKMVQTDATSMSRMLQSYKNAVADSTDKTKVFARVLQYDTPQAFQAAAKANPDAVFKQFITNLGTLEKQGHNSVKVLNDLGFTGQRMGKAFQNLVQTQKEGEKGNDQWANALRFANEEMKRNSALMEESNKRWDTATQNIKLLNNQVVASAIHFGQAFIPGITAAAKELQNLSRDVYALSADFRDQFQGAITTAMREVASVASNTGRGIIASFVLIPPILERFASAAMAVVHGLNPMAAGMLSVAGSSGLVATSIKHIAMESLKSLPLIGSVVTALEKMHALGKSKVGSVEATARIVRPGDKDGDGKVSEDEQKQLDYEKDLSDKKLQQIAEAYKKVSQAVEDELGKVFSRHSTTYQLMMQQIDLATRKRLEEVKATGASAAQIAILSAKVRELDAEQRHAANENFIAQVLGPAIPEAVKQVGNLADAWRVSGAGAKLSGDQWASMFPILETYGKMSEENLRQLEQHAPGAKKVLDEIKEKFKDVINLGGFGKQNFTGLTPNQDTGGGGNPTNNTGFNAFLKENAKAAEEAAAKNKVWADAVKASEQEAARAGKTLSAVKDAMEMLGVSSSSSAYKILSGMIVAAKASADLHTVLLKAQDAAGNFSFKNLDLAGGITAVMGIVGAFKQATDSASGFERAVGGAMVGMKVGGQVGAMFGGEMGKAWGQAIGGAVGAIAGILRGKPEWAKAAESIGKDMGVKISREMAEEILKLSKDLKISVDAASLLKLNDIIKDSGKETRSFMGEVGRLFAGIQTGAVPAKEGLQTLGDTFSTLKSEATSAGREVDGATVGMIQMARAAGLEFAGMKDHVVAALESAHKAAGGYFGKLQPSTEQAGKDQALIFSTLFWASVKELGIVKAVDAMKEPFEALKKSLSDNLGSEAMETILGPMMRSFSLFAEGPARDAMLAVDALGQVMVGIANAGYLDIDVFQAFERQALAAFGAATEGGEVTKEHLLAMAPAIQRAVSLAEQFGIPLSEDMQKLKELAEQNGITFKTDPMQEMVDILRKIAEALGVVFNEAKKAGDAISSIPDVGGGGGGGGEEDGGGGRRKKDNHGADTTAAVGFFSPSLPKDMMIQAHAGEPVLIGQPGTSIGGSPGASAGVVAELRALRQDMGRLDQKLARAVRDAVMLAA